MYYFNLSGKVDWESLKSKFVSTGVEKVRATGGMGTFWHVFQIDEKQFSVVDDADYDRVEADDKAFLEDIRTRYFSDYRPGEIIQSQRK